MKIEFNPNNLFALPPYGTVYPTVQIIDVWGVLSVEAGALIDDKWSEVSVVASEYGATAGKGWTLKLNSGWGIHAGKRKGDFVVARTS